MHAWPQVQLVARSLHAMLEWEHQPQDGRSLHRVLDELLREWEGLLALVPPVSARPAPPSSQLPTWPESQVALMSDVLGMLVEFLRCVHSALLGVRAGLVRLRVLTLAQAAHIKPASVPASTLDFLGTSLNTYICLSDCYLEVGYSGWAAAAFANAKGLVVMIGDKSGMAHHRLALDMQYAWYLVSMGDFSWAQRAMAAARDTASDVTVDGPDALGLCSPVAIRRVRSALGLSAINGSSCGSISDVAWVAFACPGRKAMVVNHHATGSPHWCCCCMLTRTPSLVMCPAGLV